jgi:hypothetical protein
VLANPWRLVMNSSWQLCWLSHDSPSGAGGSAGTSGGGGGPGVGAAVHKPAYAVRQKANPPCSLRVKGFGCRWEENSRASPPHGPREDELTRPTDTSRSNCCSLGSAFEVAALRLEVS